jgi:hypothetical protein
MSKVLAFATERQGYFDLFIESCNRNMIDPVILGWGEEWIGFGKKMMTIREYIYNLPDDEIVLSVDPFDVIFLCGLDEIENKFEEIRTSFLCGALKLSFFNSSVYNREFNKTSKKTPITPTNYNFLNTGTWISRAGYARFLIDELIDKYKMTETSMDQQLLTGIYIEQSHGVDIDWNCKIFHNLLFKDFITRRPDLKDLKFNNGRIVNTASDTRPCILHASGNANLKKLAFRLGYDHGVANPVHANIYFGKKTLFHIGQLLKPSVFFRPGDGQGNQQK